MIESAPGNGISIKIVKKQRGFDINREIQRISDELVLRRKIAFADPDEQAKLRQRGAAIRANALSKLPYLLELLERNCKANGMQVHWAEDAAEANAIVLQLLRSQQVQTLIRGSTQVAQEIGLDQHLAQHGIECIDTGLAGFIRRLAGMEAGSSLLTELPFQRAEVAALLTHHFPEIPYADSAAEIRRHARIILRRYFRNAAAGLTGVNFAVAETGTLCIAENEGNLRLAATAPRLHIALAGIEKVVESLVDIPPLLSLLTRSANGSEITSYFSMISAPRRHHERDGPHAIHFILLDNARSVLFADAALSNSLRCIRCDACLVHCPVYTRGGNSIHPAAPGAIGIIKQMNRENVQILNNALQASTLCGACAEVCPVNIPLSQNILRARAQISEKSKHPDPFANRPSAVIDVSVKNRIGWKLWAVKNRNPWIYRMLEPRVIDIESSIPQKIKPVRLADESLHQQLKNMGIANE